MFSWRDFCQTHQIEFDEGPGPHMARGNIYIACPWCDDGKRYMGLALDNTVWGCWKTTRHSGRSPKRLIRALLGCSWEAAEAFLEDVQAVPADSWEELAQRLEANPENEGLDWVELEWPEEFKPLDVMDARLCQTYLRRRGFTDPVELARKYDLRYARSGRFKQRMIIPLVEDQRLYGWTARACQKAIVRYLTFGPTGDLLFNHDGASEGGRVLLIAEGPMDALKLDFFGYIHGLRAVAVLGLHLTSAKVRKLLALADGFEGVGIILDVGATSRAFEFQERLAILRPRVVQLPEGVEDPGEMRWDQVERMAKNLGCGKFRK